VTMLIVLGVLIVTSLMLVAIFTATNADTLLSRNDLDQHKAYYAAQAGISDYIYHLNEDVNYWTHCYSTTNITVPGSTDESYSVTPLAASTAPTADNGVCSTTDPIGSMIEGGTGTTAGTFRIQSVGKSRGVTRTIVAAFTRTSFLNYIYYTKYEVEDPDWDTGEPAACGTYTPGSQPSGCGLIEWFSNDSVNGPFHSEDTLTMCGTNGNGPNFGRTSADAIEAPNYVGGGGSCVDNPDFIGTYNNNATHLLPPPNNSQLADIVSPSYSFTGVTSIVLNGASMNVTTNYGTASAATQTLPFPTNGVVYVSTNSSTGCPDAYSPFDPNYSDASDSGCGDVYVSGNYTSSLTIASDDDIIINGNVTTPVDSNGNPTTNALLGLIADNYVRVYHPINGRTSSTAGSCGSPGSNGTGTNSTLTVYAAILAVNHDFIVDNFDCGTALANLNVYGAIAQIFRGPVGTGTGAQVSTGYTKNYTYDNRLLAEEPPYFLNPVEAAWHVVRETENG
jgi:Tfp pilus assembly protein PilX